MGINNKSHLIIIFVIVACIIIVSLIGFININLNNELNDIKTQLNLSNSNLQENKIKLSEKSEMHNNSENFFKTYLNGLGTYYTAIELQESADYWFNKALEKYDDGYWSSALGWFWDSMDRYTNARIKYNEARGIFKNTSFYTNNTNYLDICSLYYKIMNASSIGMIYLYEASDYYADSCNYYLDNNYEYAHDSKDNAENKITFYNTEINKIDDYQLDLQEFLLFILR